MISFFDNYHFYNLPTGGTVYLDILESEMMLDRVLGTYEPQKHLAMEFFLKKGDSFIDIGSNKGEFSIHASLIVGESGKVIAFEPESINCMWIEKSIKKSKVNNITLVQSAVGDKTETRNLFLGEKSGWHSVIQTKDQQESISISMYSLDDYLEKNPIPNLKVIKIDVEGFEKEVILGFSKTLSSYDDIVLLFDVHPKYGVNSIEIHNILKKYGFFLYKEIYPFNLPIYENFIFSNAIAIKKEIKGY